MWMREDGADERKRGKTVGDYKDIIYICGYCSVPFLFYLKKKKKKK
jgi:hypothetical protein